MTKYKLTLKDPYRRLVSTIDAGGIQEARDEAAAWVSERMEAFGDDREALRQYGYLAAEAEALDMPERGGRITLADGWEIEVADSWSGQ